MLTPAIIPLKPPSRLQEIPRVYQNARTQFWLADFVFGKDEKITHVPLYVSSTKSADEALAVAKGVAVAAQKKGKFDLYQMMKDDTIPLAEFMLDRAESKLREMPADAAHSHTVTVEGSGTRSILLFTFIKEGMRQVTMQISLPSGGDKEGLEQYLRQVCRKRWKHTHEVTPYKDAVQPQENTALVYHSLPKTVLFQEIPLQLAFVFEGQKGFSVSLRTKDVEVAKARAEAIHNKIHELHQSEGCFTGADVQAYAETLKQSIPERNVVKPFKLDRKGPVIIKSPENVDMCKAYIRMLGDRLGVTISPMHGDTEHNWGTFSFKLPEGLSDAQKGELKDSFRAFVQTQLGKAFANGKRLSIAQLQAGEHVSQDMLKGLTVQAQNADLQITSAIGEMGFTRAGAERMHGEIFGNRIDAMFVSNALTQGIQNPFDAAIDEATVSRLREGRPQRRPSEWRDMLQTNNGAGSMTGPSSRR